MVARDVVSCSRFGTGFLRRVLCIRASLPADAISARIGPVSDRIRVAREPRETARK